MKRKEISSEASGTPGERSETTWETTVFLNNRLERPAPSLRKVRGDDIVHSLMKVWDTVFRQSIGNIVLLKLGELLES